MVLKDFPMDWQSCPLVLGSCECFLNERGSRKATVALATVPVCMRRGCLRPISIPSSDQNNTSPPPMQVRYGAPPPSSSPRQKKRIEGEVHISHTFAVLQTTLKRKMSLRARIRQHARCFSKPCESRTMCFPRSPLMIPQRAFPPSRLIDGSRCPGGRTTTTDGPPPRPSKAICCCFLSIPA